MFADILPLCSLDIFSLDIRRSSGNKKDHNVKQVAQSKMEENAQMPCLCYFSSWPCLFFAPVRAKLVLVSWALALIHEFVFKHIAIWIVLSAERFWNIAIFVLFFAPIVCVCIEFHTPFPTMMTSNVEKSCLGTGMMRVFSGAVLIFHPLAWAPLETWVHVRFLWTKTRCQRALLIQKAS